MLFNQNLSYYNVDVGLNFLPFGCNMQSTRWTAKALLFTYLVNQWAALHCVCDDLLQQSRSTDWADAAKCHGSG